MAMTDEQRAAAQAAIAKHLKRCPICDSRSFALGPDIVFLPTIDLAKKTIHGDIGHPCISVICNTCSFAHLFNVFALGLGEAFGAKPDATDATPDA